MQVTILHNVTKDEHGRNVGFHDGYLLGHALDRVFAFSLAEGGHPHDDQHVLGNLWHLFNVGDDPEFGEPSPLAVSYRSKRLRSLSVGDVVELDGRAYCCANVGWQRLVDDKPATPEQVREHTQKYIDAMREALGH